MQVISSLSSPSFSPHSLERSALAWYSLPLSTSQMGDSSKVEIRRKARARTDMLTRHTSLQ